MPGDFYSQFDFHPENPPSADFKQKFQFTPDQAAESPAVPIPNPEPPRPANTLGRGSKALTLAGTYPVPRATVIPQIDEVNAPAAAARQLELERQQRVLKTGSALNPMVGIPSEFGKSPAKLGKLAVAESQDVAEAIANKLYGVKNPEGMFRNIMSFGQDQEKPLPYDVDTADIQGWKGLYRDISEGVIQAAPQMVVGGKVSGGLKLLGLGERAAGASGMGLVFGFDEKGFDAKRAGIMAAFPVVSEFGGKIVTSTLGKLGIKPESAAAKKAVEWIGSLAASQAYMDATSAPQYLDPNLTAEERRKIFITGLGQNIAFHMMSIPGILEAGRIEKAQIQAAADAAAKEYADDFWKGVERKKPVDDQTFRNALDAAFGPPAPATPRSEINAKIRQQLKPVPSINRMRVARPQPPTPNAPNPLDQSQGGVPQYQGTPQGQNVPANPTEVRKEEGAGPSGGNRPVGATPQPNAPEAGPEIVAAAAIKLPDGTIARGSSHPSILAVLPERILSQLKESDNGFITSTGRFVSREEAGRIEGWDEQALKNTTPSMEDIKAVRKEREEQRPPPVTDAAGRLQQLKSFENPTPEEIAERDALQAKSDAANKAGAEQMKAQLEALKKQAAQPETITQAAYRDAQGVVHTGANHPEILHRLGIKGFETRESRNTPQFGFVTNRRPFVPREESAQIAKAAGQQIEPFEIGPKGLPVAHSNEVASPVQPEKPLSEVTQKPFPAKLAKQLLSLPPERQSDAFGPQNAELRQDIIEAITGKRPPKAKAGARAVQDALARHFGIDASKLSGAALQEAIVKRLTEIRDAAEANRGGKSITAWAYNPNGMDILDHIHDLGGIAMPSQMKFSGGEYDAYKSAFGTGMAMRLKRPEGGIAADLLMNALNDVYGYRLHTADEMYREVEKANTARQGKGKTQSKEAAQLRNDLAQHEDFRKSVVEGEGTNAKAQVAGDALQVGGVFSYKGEKFRVTEYDPDSDTYIVEDGRRFGRQYLSADETFHPDKGSVSEQSAEFVPGEAKSHQQILASSKQVKVTVPEGATAIRVTMKDGKSTVQSMSNVNKGENVFRGTDVAKIEAGTIGKDKKFVPMKGDVTVEDKSAPKPVEPKREDFTLGKPESVEEQKARQAAENQAALKKAEHEKLRELAQKPLVGTVGDIGQKDMFGGGDLLSDSGQRRAQLPEAVTEPKSLTEQAAVGLDEIRTLLSDARSELDANTREVALALLQRPVFRNLDWSKLMVSLRNQIEGGARGAAEVANNLIELSNAANSTTFPHEVFHFLYEMLPENYRTAINEARLAELREKFGNSIPPAFASGTLTSEQFQQAQLDRSLYHLSNPSEYLANFAGEKFSRDTFAGRNATFWQQLKSNVANWVRGIVNAVKRTLKIRPDMNRAYDELLAGTWKPTPESGLAFEQRQASLPITTKAYEKERAFGERATPERVLAAFGDVVSLKNRAADEIQAGDRARALVNQFGNVSSNQELLTALASADLGQPRLVFGNYDAMRARTEGSDMGLRSSVIIDAFRGMGYEQHRMLKLRQKLAEQQAVVNSKSFQGKLEKFWSAKDRAEDAEEVRQTFQNQISHDLAAVMRELNTRGKTEAQYDQLRSDYARLQKLPEFSEAVAQRVDDIINTVAASEGGIEKLTQYGPRSGSDIYQTYLDLKESTAAREKAGLPGVVDPALLSPEDRAKVEAARQTALTGDQKAFAQLASAVLSANRELRMRLIGVEYARMHPEFKAEVSAVGERFRKQWEQNPENAVKQVIKMASRLTKKEIDAEATWLRLNKQVLPELRKLNDLEEAVAIDEKVQSSPEWKKLVNQILEDNSRLGQAFRIPDSEIPHVKANGIWNEFTGKQQLRTPQGAIYDIDIGWTRQSAKDAQFKMQAFVAQVDEWLANPKNADNPDRRYWQQKRDFVEMSLNTSTVLNPTVTYALGGKLTHTPLGMMEFLVQGSSMPSVKLVGLASSSFQRAWAVADQWFQSAPEILMSLEKAARSHGMNPDMEMQDYRNTVLNPLASEYRNGRAVKAGDRLINGTIVTQADIAALKMQGRKINELFDAERNIGREKIMVNGLLIDQWARNVFGIRAPQELGAEAGTTLPREFSQRGQALAARVAKAQTVPEVLKILNEPHIFDNYVKPFFAERGAEFSTLSPYEDLYKQLVQKWRMADADAPQTVEEIGEWLQANTSEDVPPGEPLKWIVGEMAGQLRKYYKDFVDKPEATDVRADRATKQTAFTQGFQRDVGNSFFYDYGVANALEVRSLGVDSTNFYLVRLVKSLDAATEDLKRALDEYEPARSKGVKAQQKFIKEHRPAFKAGEDFRDFERLQTDYENVKYMRDVMPKAYGSAQLQTIEMFSRFGRFTGDTISLALGGLTTSAKVLTGSTVKMGLVVGGLQRFYMLGNVQGLISTLMSIAEMGGKTVYKGVVKSPELAGKFAKTVSSEGWKVAFGKSVQTAVEGFFNQGKFFNTQYQMGLGFKSPAGFRALNIWNMPSSHGGQYTPRPSQHALIRMTGRAFYKLAAAAEFPMELAKSMFPQAAYAISYDAGARVACNTVDMMGSQARRAFEYLEKTGQIKAFDLLHPNSLQNEIPAGMILPRGVFPKGETNIYQARDWWARSIDLPLNEMVINYWRRLSQTPKAERGDVSFLASDVVDPAKVKHTEEARMAALMSVMLKDIHHAATENRPVWLRNDSTLRFLFPLYGWTLHSLRKTAQALGRSPRDSRGKLALAAAGATILGFMANAILTGEAEKNAKKAVAEWINGEVYPEKLLLQAQSPTELAKLTAIDAVGWIPAMHNLAADLLGESSQSVNSGGISVFTVQKLSSVLNYAKGVIATGDPTYGLAALGKQTAPFLRGFINKLDSQRGLVELKNARTIVQKFGPEDLLNKGTVVFHEPTEMTPFRQQLSNAVFKGNPAEVQQATDAFLQKAVDLGKTQQEAQTMLREVMSSLNPLQVGGKKLTADQREEMLPKLNTRDAATLAAAEQNWLQASGQMNLTVPLTKTATSARGGGGSMGGAIALPSTRKAVNRMRVRGGRTPRLRSTRIRGVRRTGLRVPKLRVSRQRFRKPSNRVRRSRKIVVA